MKRPLWAGESESACRATVSSSVAATSVTGIVVTIYLRCSPKQRLDAASRSASSHRRCSAVLPNGFMGRVAMRCNANLGSLQGRRPSPASCAYNDSDGNLLAVGQPARTVADTSDRPHAADATHSRIPRQRLCPDTEEVTGSNPVSPTKKALASGPFATLRARLALGSVDLSAKLCRPIAWRHRRSSSMARPHPASNDWPWRSINSTRGRSERRCRRPPSVVRRSVRAQANRRCCRGANRSHPAGDAIRLILPGQDQHSVRSPLNGWPLDSYPSEVHSPNYVRSS
jgi:hypothetical protein